MTNNISFVIPCKFSKEYGFLIKNCVQSIRQHYPDNDIFVVDSSSDSKEYAKNLILKYNVKFLNVNNKNFSTGALWTVFDIFKENYDYYFLIHDSTKILKPINVKKGLDVAPVMCGGPWKWPRVNTVRQTNGKKIGPRSSQWAHQECRKNNVHFTENFNSILGPMFLVSNQVLNEISKSGFYNIRPTNKHQSETMERLWAMKFTNMNLGEQMTKNSLLGDFRKSDQLLTICNKQLKTHYIDKKDSIQKFWIERQ